MLRLEGPKPYLAPETNVRLAENALAARLTELAAVQRNGELLADLADEGVVTARVSAHWARLEAKALGIVREKAAALDAALRAAGQ